MALQSFALAANSTANTLVWNGGQGVISVQGTFNGATVTLQVNDGGGNATTSAFQTLGVNTTFTSAGIAGFDLAAGFVLRIAVTGAGASTNLRVTIGTEF